MFARVVEFQGPTESLTQAAEQRFRQQVLPQLQQQAGFQRALVLLDRTGGRLLGITLWDTAAHREAAAGAMEPQRSRSASEMGATAAGATDYEVVVEL